MFTEYFNKISNLSDDTFHFRVINALIARKDNETIEKLREVLSLSDNEQRNIIIEENSVQKATCVKSKKNGECLLFEPSFYDKNIAEISQAQSAFDWFVNSGTVNAYLFNNHEREKENCFAEYMLTLLYESYSRKKHSKHSREQGEIARLYSGESEYDKYELVSLSSNHEFMDVSMCPRIYDKNLNKTIMLKAISKPFADKLNELLNTKNIGCLSFRLDNYGIYDGRYATVPLMEAVEQGKKYYSLKLGIDNMVTKLYRDECYRDALYIFSSPNELTFEEIYADEKKEDDTVVTSVVPLIFAKVGTDFQIQHVDHEFVFYTNEEFENKKKDSKQRGKGYKRVKTFKADECSIPLDLPCEVNWKEKHPTKFELVDCSATIPFIQFVLDNCMEHADLIYEYFAKELSDQ